MIATIKLYEDKEEGRDYICINKYFCTTWEASISAEVWQWITDHAYRRLVRGGIWVIDGEELIDFEDFYREHYGDYPFSYSSAYRSQALTFEVNDNYGIKFID